MIRLLKDLRGLRFEVPAELTVRTSDCAAIVCHEVSKSKGPNHLSLLIQQLPVCWWRRRCEETKVGHTQTLLYLSHPLYGSFETIFAKLLMFDLFEFLSDLIKPFVVHRRFPCWKNNSIFNRRVVFVHADKRLESVAQSSHAAPG